MAQRDLRVSNRPTRPYTMREFIRDELEAEPLTLTQVAGFLLGLAGVVLFVVLFLSGGPVPS